MSKPGDRVLDFFAGSGTTGVVAGGLGRKFTLIDQSPDSFQIVKERLTSRGLSFEILEK